MQYSRGNPGLARAVKLPWPTPDAAVSNDGEELASWEARRRAVAATGINGNGMGTPLAVAVRQGWPTPKAQDGDGRGGQEKRATGRRSNLLDAAAPGLLNPRWVEALMGWPLGFLGLPPEVLGPLVAALRKRRGSRREPADESRSGGNS